MHNVFFLFTTSLLLVGFLPAFSESYNLQIDEHSYDLEYQADADVLAMAIDQELNSLLIGIENANDSLFSIKLPNEMISAEKNEFAVLVNGLEVDYELKPLGAMTEISFFVPNLSQEIEIIGTHVIPEFPIVVLILILTITGVVLFTKNTRLGIK